MTEANRGVGATGPELISFDCYGTLIDWESGILDAIRRRFPEAHRMDDELILREYHRVEADAEDGPFRPYRAVLEDTGVEVASRFNWNLRRGDRGFLGESLPDWRPFPDTNPALRELSDRGHRLAIASNVDDDLLAGTLDHLEVEFDLLVTALDVESYKPDPPHFQALLDEVEGDRNELLHVAASPYHDVRPASAMGIPVVWVNRRGDDRPGDLEPDAEVPDLAAAVRWIHGEYGSGS